MSRRTQTVLPDDFAGIYASAADPLRFTSSTDGRDTYAAALAALPRGHHRSAFERACSTGMFTCALAERCDRLRANDLVPAAVESARARCTDRPDVEIRQDAVPADWPGGRFDLTVRSGCLSRAAPPDPAARFDSLLQQSRRAA